MTCEKCKENRIDVKDWNLKSFGVFSLCTPCMRLVSEWLCEIETNIRKSLYRFVIGEEFEIGEKK